MIELKISWLKTKNDKESFKVFQNLGFSVYNLEEPENEKQRLQEKEIKAKEHLEEMSEITRNLSYNDIKLLKRNAEGKGKKQNEKDQQMDEDWQKERQE